MDDNTIIAGSLEKWHLLIDGATEVLGCWCWQHSHSKISWNKKNLKFWFDI